MYSHGTKNTEIQVAHWCVVLLPVATMLYSHSLTASQKRRQVSGVVSCAASAAEQHQRIIQHGSLRVFVLLKPAQEARDLLAQEHVILCKLQLPILIASVG